MIKLLVIVDETDEKAQAKEAEYRALASREGAKVLFGGWIGQDLAKYGPDEDLRQVGTPPVQGVRIRSSPCWPCATADDPLRPPLLDRPRVRCVSRSWILTVRAAPSANPDACPSTSLFPEVEKWTADALADKVKFGGMGPGASPPRISCASLA